LPISAVDTVNLAFQHTRRQLVQPFRFWQWTRLAIVGLLAGELGSGGSFNFPSSFKPQQGSSPGWGHFPKIDPALLAGLITVIVVTGLIFMIVMTYVSSVMRFILFDSVLTKECHIRANWARRTDAGWKYFLWQLGFTLVLIGAAIILIGVPLALAAAMGWFHAPRSHVLGLVLGGLVFVGVLILFFVAVAIVHVFTKDFVVPQMALEGIGAVEGWRRLWSMIQPEKGAYAIYAGMKIVLAIGAGIVTGIASFILTMIVAIPVVGVILVMAVAGKNSGFTWNASTITAVVVLACIVFAALLYLISLISVPVIVFFPAYAMYFFAARYRPLSLALYPPPPNSGIGTQGTPAPPEPPPLMPAPEPAG
jgi:hypothetical protein